MSDTNLQKVHKVKNSTRENLYRMILSAMFLALALILPFFTGQIPQIGAALCPMHFPIILCAFFCGPLNAVVIGMFCPILRFAIFGMPPIMPTGIGMCFELATYGLVVGLLYQALPKKKINIYVSLIAGMIAGRVVWGIIRTILFGVTQTPFGWAAFIGGAFLNAIPGIIAQIVLIPIIVMALQKYTKR